MKKNKIIENYTPEEIVQELISMIRNTPNDMDLGKIVRNFFTSEKENEQN